MTAVASSVAMTLALRYLRTRKKRFAAFITWVSVAGLTLGVMVLTVVLSVMNGFDAELKQRILGTVPHLLLPQVKMADPLLQEIQADAAVTAAYDFFLGAGMVTRSGAVNPVAIYGIDPNDRSALKGIAENMVSGALGDLDGSGRNIVLGAPLASHLGLLPGDSVVLILSEPTRYGLQPRIQAFRLVGTFEVGADLDYGLAIMALSDIPIADLSSIGTEGVRLELQDPLLADGIARQIRARHPELQTESWSSSFGELFDAVRLEKVLMFLTLLMVVAVAAFNIVSGQMMVVMDKRSDIAILRTMGADSGTILGAFLFQGVLISTLGIVVGLGLGLLVSVWIARIVALMKAWFGFGLLDGTYFVEVPVLIQSADLMLIGALSWMLCLLSAWIPARRAAALNPIDGLHG